MILTGNWKLYCSGDFQSMLNTSGIVSSMNCKGNCWDNAVAESFFGSLKNERVFLQRTKPETKLKKISLTTSKCSTTAEEGIHTWGTSAQENMKIHIIREK